MQHKNTSRKHRYNINIIHDALYAIVLKKILITVHNTKYRLYISIITAQAITGIAQDKYCIA